MAIRSFDDAVHDYLVRFRKDKLREERWFATQRSVDAAIERAAIAVIDATTPAGRLQLHVLGAIAEFERARIAERVRPGMARARSQGQRFGRRPHRIEEEELERTAALSLRKAASVLGVPRSVLHRARLSRKPLIRLRNFLGNSTP